MGIRRNVEIFGFPFCLLALPMALHGAWKTRHRELGVDIYGNREDVEDSWITKEICLECEEVTDHLFLVFADEPVVESECQSCKLLRVHTDRRE